MIILILDLRQLLGLFLLLLEKIFKLILLLRRLNLLIKSQFLKYHIYSTFVPLIFRRMIFLNRYKVFIWTEIFILPAASIPIACLLCSFILALTWRRRIRKHLISVRRYLFLFFFYEHRFRLDFRGRNLGRSF